jgi:hypothetical protein
MEFSLFLAQVIGLYLVAISLMMLIRHRKFKKTILEFIHSAPLITLSGSWSILLGLLIVIPHNIWILEWPLVITLVGWFSIVQGLARLFYPEDFAKAIKYLVEKKGYLLTSWIWLCIGIYLVWAGFTQ